MKSTIQLAYDHACKQIISHKPLLAYLLKQVIPEYHDLSLKDIVPLIEEGNEETSHIFARNNALVNEFNERIEYDVLFTCKFPNSNNHIDVIINLEMQNQYHNKYPLIKRGIYYSAEMITMQKGSVFKKDNYQNMKPVYSIWICSKPPKKMQNTIQCYKMQEVNMLGKKYYIPKEDYDVSKIVMINLGEDEEGILSPLNTLFFKEDSYANKVEALKKYGIQLKDERKVEDMCNFSQGIFEKGRIKNQLENIQSVMYSLKVSLEEAMNVLRLSEEDKELCREEMEDMPEVEDMCNFSQGILEDGINRGKVLGLEEGEEKGIIKAKLESIKGIMEHFAISVEEAMDIVKITNDEKDTYREMLKEYLH